jgi:hypothetical protein
MAARRFEVTFVPEPIRNDSSSQPSEIIPLVHIENEIPPPPPLLPASLSSAKEKNNPNRLSSRLFSSILQRKSLDTRRRATLAAAVASFSNQIKRRSLAVGAVCENESTSTPPRSSSQTNFPIDTENDEADVYSTTQSNNYNTNPLRITNTFLQELRLKRRELHEKSKNIAIDLRIDRHRQQNQRRILRAQDIFDVHFHLNDDDDNDDNLLLSETNMFTEESQEKIRNEIYNELNRQQKKQNLKHHRHLLLGRALLMLMTSVLAFMSITLIYVVIDLYNRADSLDAKLPENEFISMTHDKTKNLN